MTTQVTVAQTTSSIAHRSLYPKCDLVLRQKFWRDLRYSRPLNVFVGFLKFVQLLVCGFRSTPPDAVIAVRNTDDAPSVSYLAYFLYPFRGIDELDYNSFSHHTYGILTTLLECLQRLVTRLRGERLSFSLLGEIVHNHPRQYRPSITNNHLDYLSLILSPRNAVNLLRYNRIACQISILMCHSPAVRTRAGILNFHNYITTDGGAS